MKIVSIKKQNLNSLSHFCMVLFYENLSGISLFDTPVLLI